MRLKWRRRKIFANSLHKELVKLFALASIVPAIIVALCFYYYLLTTVGSTESLSSDALTLSMVTVAKQVLTLLIIAIPVCVLTILFFTRKITHTIIGPFDRIINEIDRNVEGERKGPIHLRKGDKFKPLVDRINILLEKTEK